MKNCEAKGIVGRICKNISGEGSDSCYLYQQARLESPQSVRQMTELVQEETGCKCRRDVLSFIKNKSNN